MTSILITGANGFIGTRLAEVAVARGYETVGLVRNWSRTARVARVPIRLVRGDVLDRGSLEAAMHECDMVIHCATDFGARGDQHYRSIVEGTANVVELAARAGVRRVVHVSSAAVHGLFPAGPALPEELVTTRTGIPYCDGKIDAEREATRLAAQGSLPLVIVRPTIVFGPWGTHDSRVNQLLRERRMLLVDGARGHFNGIYIDNLVDAILAALSAEGAPGRILHLTDDTPTTWRHFIHAHARAVDPDLLPLPEASHDELRRLWRGEAPPPPSRPDDTPAVLQREQRTWLARVVSRALTALRATTKPAATGHGMVAQPANQIHPIMDGRVMPTLSEHEVDMFRIFDQVTFRAESAKAVLGFRSRISFEEGMARTAAWIRWRADGAAL